MIRRSVRRMKGVRWDSDCAMVDCMVYSCR